jgi:hypothetical protein
MSREFRFGLLLVAICALPTAAMAQGVGQAGMAGPRAKDNNDDRRDRFFLHGVPPHVPPGGTGPGLSSSEPHEGVPRTKTDFGPSDRPSTFDPLRNYDPATAETFRPSLPPEAFAPLRFSDFNVPAASEPSMSVPRFVSNMHSSSAGMGRGLAGLFGAAGAGIAAFFRRLVGRRQE